LPAPESALVSVNFAYIFRAILVLHGGAGSLLTLLGLVGVAYGIYALVRGGRDLQGGLGPIPERAIHAVAGIRMLVGGAVTIFLGILAVLSG
jgi:hypothetical protein